jgi:2,3-bisphosphoglycerate-dependent phosphoglycerate mutase
MAAEVCHHAIGTLQSHSYLSNLNQHQNLRSNSLRLATKDFSSSNGLLKGKSSHFGQKNCIVTRSSATHSQTSVVDPVLSPSRSNTSDTSKKSSTINFPVDYIFCYHSVSIVFLLIAC